MQIVIIKFAMPIQTSVLIACQTVSDVFLELLIVKY